MLRVNPDLTPAEIKDKIMDSADIVTDLYDSNVAGGRRVNAYRAVKAALDDEDTNADDVYQLDPLPVLMHPSLDPKRELWNPLTPSGSNTSSAPDPLNIRVGGVDSDDDGLIEIASRRQLYNIRYNMDGTSLSLIHI